MRRGTWARLCGVLALALLALPARVMATTANDLCAAAADPCTVSTAVVVSDGSTIDVGTRELRIAAGGALDVGSGTMTLMAGRLTVNAGGFVRALGTSTTSGGTITAHAGDVTNAGTIDASGTPGGSITIAATGTLSVTGPITSRALARDELGGTIQLSAAVATLTATLSVVGGFDAVGGDITVDTTGDLTVAGTLDVTGGDGGGLDIQAGQAGGPGGNLTLGDASILKADATTAGGFGGTVDVTAVGDGVTSGHVTLNGQASSIGLAGSLDIGGGSGGCIDVQATGNIRIDRSSAELNVEGGPPDGDGGEVDINTDAGAVVLMGTATASVLGDQSSGGSVSIDAVLDVTIGGSILVNGGDGGGGEATVSSSTASVSLSRSGVIDASSSAAGLGGGICVDSGKLGTQSHSILVEGRLSADGGPGGGSGGGIDLEGGDSVRVAGTGSLHAAGGTGAGAGGTLTVNADPGIVLLEGPLVATGGGPTGPGGIVAVDAVGRINVAAPVDARGAGPGGRIGFATDTGPVDILSDVTASSSTAAGGSVEVVAQGAVRIAASVVTDGTAASATGAGVQIIGCTVTVCGLDSPSCPAGGVGVLSSLGPSGVNRITGRDAAVVLGTMRASQSNGRNELVFDGQAAHEPLVLGMATPPATLITDTSILPCPACGNHVIEPPETCDDGNMLDGDGCSSSCQVEAVVPGDANGDQVLSPDDVGFAIQEIFDGDGDSVTTVSGGAFAGSPGADSNGDDHVTAADLTATIKLLAGGA